MITRALHDVVGRLKNICVRKPWPLHRDEDIAPFFIVGAGRSGTTLLRRVLVASQQVHIPPETYVLAQVIEYYKRNAYQDWQDLVRDCMALFEMHPEFDTFQISLRPLLPQLRALPEHERSLAKILDMFYRYHAEQTGMPSERWGDKTPINTFALDDIYAVFPKARFIHLLRDGVDVVYSCMQRGLIVELEDAANRWKNALHAFRCFEQKYPQVCLTLRYESMVAQPDLELSQVCIFLNILYDQCMIDDLEYVEHMGDMKHRHYTSSLECVSKKYIGQGRAGLSLEQKKNLQFIIGDELHSLGYFKTHEGNDE